MPIVVGCACVLCAVPRASAQYVCATWWRAAHVDDTSREVRQYEVLNMHTTAAHHWLYTLAMHAATPLADGAARALSVPAHMLAKIRRCSSSRKSAHAGKALQSLSSSSDTWEASIGLI